MHTILITGGTGFIGSHLVKYLISTNYDAKIIILKRSTSDTYRLVDVLDKIICYDIDKVDLEYIFQNNSIDTIIHLATYYKKENIAISEMVSTNIGFALAVLDHAVKYKVPYFINTGTYFEYDRTNYNITETTDLKPYNIYARTKICFEDILKDYTREFDINAVTLKIFSPYGAFDNEKIIPILIKNALNGSEIFLKEPFSVCDFIYIADVIDLYFKVISTISTLSSKYEVYNVCSGNSYSIMEIANIICKLMDYSTNIQSNSDEKNKKIKYLKADPTKAVTLLNWYPRYSIYEGLQETINYYRGNI